MGKWRKPEDSHLIPEGTLGFQDRPSTSGRFGFRGAPGRNLTDNPRLRTAPLFVLSYWSIEIGYPGWIRTRTGKFSKASRYFDSTG